MILYKMALAAFLLFGHIGDDALFSRVKTVLNSKQTFVIENIKKQKVFVAMNIVQLRERLKLDETDPITIPLPNKRSCTIEKYKISGSDSYTLLTAELEQNIILVFTNDSASGIIQIEEASYLVEPLGDGLHAIILVDPTKYD